ncbi:MAG TPA: DEAD/DEAH box helicase family protein [Chitinophagales bacterium]|nr:DEAD/DEAH box helicase family protein [Chitinophagales bacterium]
MIDTSQLNEAEVRYNIIDPQLINAGWNLADRTQISFEVPVDGYDASPINGITDYCLYRNNGEVIAVIEAKHTRRDARVGKEQVLQYVTKIAAKQSFRPYAFMTNGEDIWFWDSETHAERFVAGFFTKENLERLLFLKQNKLPLNEIKIKDSIVNRSYQVEAIRRISETIEKRKKRKALLVMATGTGKTRTIMALIDIFLRARQAQKVLFLADRDSLVDQALSDGFKVHLPSEARTRIRTYDINLNARVYVSTLQTLELCYEKFSPADFDLIIADECHRSIYNKFTDVLAYFDAVQIGLTATPAHFIDRDTFRFFECDGPMPTFLYTYDQAVKDKYLADFNLYAAQTKFQRKGIRGIDLSEEEQESLRERGIDPEDINFEGTDLEKKVTNHDTLIRQWEEFMDVCYKDASGQLPAKTILFAVTHKHAMRLQETFNEMYPEHRGLLARVIDSKTERAKDLLDQFKKQDFPRIAISVDMLDTGVDIPEVMNLAFMKPVNSQIKFWQMIGRGTRSFEACKHLEWLPENGKDNFLIVDFWENFEHFNMMPKDDKGSSQIPVLVTIFNNRLNKLKLLLGSSSNSLAPPPDLLKEGPLPDVDGERGSPFRESEGSEGDDFKRIMKELRADIAKIPLDSFTVKKHLKEVREAWTDDFWNYINTQKIEFLRMKVAPLLRFASGVNLAEAFFTSKMERAGLQLLKADVTLSLSKGDAQATLADSIKEDISLLPTNLPQIAPHRALIEEVLSNKFWEEASLQKIDSVKNTLAPLMKYKREKPSMMIELGLDDIIDSRKWIIVKKEGQKVMVEEYRKRVEEKIEQLAQQHPTIARLKSGEKVSLQDLIALEETLETELSSEDLNLTDDNMLKAFGVRVGSLVDFLKFVLKLEALPSYDEIVRQAFDAFILEHHYNADQTRFLRTVQTVFMQKRKLEEADLYDAPFSNFGMNAVEKLFTNDDVKEIIELTKRLVA